MSNSSPVVRHLLAIARTLYVLTTAGAVFLVLARLNAVGFLFKKREVKRGLSATSGEHLLSLHHQDYVLESGAKPRSQRPELLGGTEECSLE